MLAFAFILITISIVSLESVSAAQSISVVDVNSSYSAVYVTNPDNMFAYEINFDITSGSTNTVGFAGFFGAGVTTTSGSALDGSTVLSIYESILGNNAVGITNTGTYNLFNVTHSGAFSLQANLFIKNSKAEDSPAICGNGATETGEDCDESDLNGETCVSRGYDSGSLSCTNDCSYDLSACESASPVVPATGTGGGGGAAAAVLNVSSIKISARPDELIVSVVAGKDESRTVTIKNNGGASVDLTLGTSGLNAESTLDKTQVTLAPGRSETITLTFRELRKGIYAGKILISYRDNVVKEVPFIVNMRSEDFLFDSKLSIVGGKYVLFGQDLTAKIELKEVAVQNEPVDVTINYMIKGFDGSTLLDESETFAVLQAKTFMKNFSTADLPVGKYVLGIEVVYPGAFATSTAQFSVVTEKPSIVSFALIIILAMVVVFIIVVVWAVRRESPIRPRRINFSRRKRR